MSRRIATALLAVVVAASAFPASAFAAPTDSASIAQEVFETNQLIREAEAELDRLGSELERTTRMIIATRAELRDARQALDRFQTRVDRRFVDVYKNTQGVMAMALLVNSGSFSDFFHRMAFLLRVGSLDRKLLADRLRHATEVEELHDQLTATKETLLDSRKDLNKEKSQLKVLLAEKEKLQRKLAEEQTEDSVASSASFSSTPE